MAGKLPFSFLCSFLMSIADNYRNHRKIVVIDGGIGYTGGFNVGDEYLGQRWRRTGEIITCELPAQQSILQNRFLMDWNSQHALEIKYDPALFPEIKTIGDSRCPSHH